MSSSSVETVFSNVDLVLHIYQQLDFESQLRLSRVNSQLASVFHIFLFKEKFPTLNIFEKGFDFIVANQTQRHQLQVNLAELQQFFNVYAQGVEKLNLRNVNVDVEMFGYMTTDLTFGQMIVRNLLNMEQFKNLKSITYHFMSIPSDHMRLVAELYPNLEALSFTNCSLGNNVYWILDEVLPRMQNLNYLCIRDSLRFRLPFRKFQELVHQGVLETLHVSAALEPGEGLQHCGEYCQSQLRELHIETTFEAHKWPHNFDVYLGYFENLTILQVEILESITDETLAIIAFACKELEDLNIRFSRFDNVTRMVMPPKVHSLSLNCCRGLTHTNLQQILTQFQIRKFISKETAYDGEFLGFAVSPLLESLHVDAVFTHGFKFDCEVNALKELTWHHPWSTEIDAIGLETCSQLSTLNIQEGYVDLNSLMKLRSLTNLTIPHPVPLLSWSYITTLLTHTTLKKLSIRSFSSFRFRYERMATGVPNDVVKTGIVELEIPLDICDVALAFWLDMLRVNKNLKTLRLTFYPNDKYDEFLIRLVHHEQFPKAVRNIDVCGFTINCNQFRRNSTDFLEKFFDQTNNTNCWHENDMYTIIIEKKY